MILIAIVIVRSFWARDVFYLGSDQQVSLSNGCIACTFALHTYSSVVVDNDRFGATGHLLEDRSPSVQSIEQAIWGFSLKTHASRIPRGRKHTFAFAMPLWPLALLLFVVGRPRWKDKKEKKKPAVQMGWFDEQFTTIGWPMLIALSVLFMVLMWIFSGWGLLVMRNPVARRKAKMIFIVLSIYLLIAILVGLFVLAHLAHAGTAA